MCLVPMLDARQKLGIDIWLCRSLLQTYCFYVVEDVDCDMTESKGSMYRFAFINFDAPERMPV